MDPFLQNAAMRPDPRLSLDEFLRTLYAAEYQAYRLWASTQRQLYPSNRREDRPDRERRDFRRETDPRPERRGYSYDNRYQTRDRRQTNLVG